MAIDANYTLIDESLERLTMAANGGSSLSGNLNASNALAPLLKSMEELLSKAVTKRNTKVFHYM